MAIEPCITGLTDRRRTFWTTQPCGADESCGDLCGAEYGLKVICSSPNCPPPAPGVTRTIATDNWVTSLALNILLTTGKRPDSPCGYRPGARGGHWSDSFRPNEYAGSAGSMIATLNAHKSITDALAELRAIVKFDMQKLVKYQVATGVEVDVEYKGRNRASVSVRIKGFAGESLRVGATLTRIKNAWAWET